MEDFIIQDQFQPWTYGKGKNNSWISEAIWGHRLKGGQTVNVLLNEFLVAAESHFRIGKLLEPTHPNSNPELTVRFAKQLRCVLFLNPYLEQVLDKKLSSDASWEVWTKLMGENLDSGHPDDFSNLAKQDFSDFADRVKLMRRIVLDTGARRKWSNQLLFPIGPDALYVPTDNKFARARELFTRTGEIAYLLLTRADTKLLEALKPHFKKLFDPTTPKNKLLLSLTKADEFGEAINFNSYLPYKRHPAANRLAEDLLSIFSLNLPELDAYAVIKHLIAFHLYLYILETAKAWMGKPLASKIVCEILNQKMDLVRRVSGAMKRENEDACKSVINIYIDHVIASDPKISRYLSDTEIDESSKVKALQEFFKEDPLRFQREFQAETIAELKDRARKEAELHFASGIGQVLEELGRNSGLTSRKKTNRYRYCPSDELLTALILANVTSKVEEGEVLARLYKRYGLIIGHNQAESALDAYQYDKNQYDLNGARFRKRLMALGLSQRQSDACTYILNPYCD